MKMNKTNIAKAIKATKTLEELKKTYVEMVSVVDDEKLEAYIDDQFEKHLAKVKDVHVNAKGETYNKVVDEKDVTEFKKVVAKLLNAGLRVEVCGTWMWITGTEKGNKEHRQALPDGARWSPKKKAWYLKPAGTPARRSRGWTMEKIRDAYGSHVITNPDEA